MTTRLRVVAVLAALGLLTGACDEGSIELRSRDRGGSASTMILVPQDGGEDAPARAGGGGGAGGNGSQPGSGGSEPDDDDGGSPDGGDDAPVDDAGVPLPIDDRARVGSMGRALLRADVAEVAIEIDTTPGESLTGQARAGLQAQAEEHGNKQVVGFVGSSSLPEQDVYTSSDLRSLMEVNRATWSTSQRVGIYVMVLSGRHENEGVVGVSFNASAFAIFTEQLGGGLLGLNYPSYEAAVVVHELGHLFGLVNLTGRGAFHEDPEHRGHSKNEGSVMYWAVESTLVGDIFSGGPPDDFDAEDEQEMEAIRQG